MFDLVTAALPFALIAFLVFGEGSCRCCFGGSGVGSSGCFGDGGVDEGRRALFGLGFFGFQEFAVFAIVAVKDGDFVVVDGPQGIGYGIDEVAVVRYKQNGTVVLVEHVFEGFAGADIEVIGGFVEDQQIAADEGELCQCDTPAFTTRQRPNALEDIIAREQKASQKGPCLGLFDERADAAHFVEDRIGHDQSFVGLGIVVDLDVAPQPGMTAERRQFADHGAHQRCFAAAVDAHQRDALLAA